MKVNWNKINDKTAVLCDSEEKAESLLKLNELRGGESFRGDAQWRYYQENTCYSFDDDDDKYWNYGTKQSFKVSGYDVIEYDDIFKHDIPRTSEILKLEPNYIINIERYSANPCVVNDEYNLINSKGIPVGGNWIAKMINDESIYKIQKRKQMTVAEIEKELGYPIQIVE